MNDYPSLPSESDPVLGREGSPWGYAQLAADALAPSNLSSFYRDRIAPVFGSEDNAPGTKVKPPKGSVLDPQESALRESIQPATANDFDRVVQVITKHGVFPQDPRFLKFLGATAEQNDMTPSARLGPLAGIRDWLFPDAVKLQKRQAALKNIGMLVFQDLAARQLEALHGPQTMREANAIAPGAVQPNPDQIIEAPRRGDMADAEGPMPGIVDPNAGLTLNQQTQLQPILKGITGGHLMTDDTGKIVPTSYQAAQMKNLTPEQQAQFWTQQLANGVITPEQYALNLHAITQPQAPSVTTALGSQALQNRSTNVHALGQPIRDYLAAKGLPPVPANITEAREALKQEADAVEQQKALYKAGSDQQGMLAQRMFGKFPYQLSPAELAVVNEHEAQRAAKLASYEKAATITAVNETQPLNEGSFFWLDDKGHPARPDMTRPEATQQGYKPVPPSAVDAVSAARASKHILGEYREVIEKVLVKSTGNTVKDLGKIKLNQIGAWVKEHAGDPDVQRLDALNSNLAMYSRALGDTANIAVAEQMMRLAALPNWKSTQESALDKLTSLERILDNVIKARGLPVDQSLNSYYKPDQPRVGQVVKILGDEDYNKLPKGAHYIGPDGVERVK